MYLSHNYGLLPLFFHSLKKRIQSIGLLVPVSACISASKHLIKTLKTFSSLSLVGTVQIPASRVAIASAFLARILSFSGSTSAQKFKFATVYSCPQNIFASPGIISRATVIAATISWGSPSKKRPQPPLKIVSPVKMHMFTFLVT